MSSYIDLKFINDLSGRLNSLKRKLIIYLTLDVHIVVILKSPKQRQEHICIELKMICSLNVIIVVEGQNLANFIKFVDPKLYEQYLLERYKKSQHLTPKPKFDFKPTKFTIKHR